MKTINLLFAAAFFFLTEISAQVPDSIVRKFTKNYPEINNAKWQTEGQTYKVMFKDIDSVENSVIFGTDGKLICSQMQLISTQIPVAIVSYCNKKFSPETEYKVWEKKDAAGNKTYFVTKKTEILYFDESGNYLRKEAKNEKKETTFVSEKK